MSGALPAPKPTIDSIMAVATKKSAEFARAEFRCFVHRTYRSPIDLFHTGARRPALGELGRTFFWEGLVTIQSVWRDALLASKDGTKQYRWRRFLVGIMEARQKKADEVVGDYLRRRAEDGVASGRTEE
jgi:hypothetical protein